MIETSQQDPRKIRGEEMSVEKRKNKDRITSLTEEVFRLLEKDGYKYDPPTCSWYLEVKNAETGEIVELPIAPWGIKDRDISKAIQKSLEKEKSSEKE